MTYCELCTLPIQDENQLFLLNRRGTPHYYHEHCISGTLLTIDTEYDVLYVQKVNVGTSISRGSAFTQSNPF